MGKTAAQTSWGRCTGGLEPGATEFAVCFRDHGRALGKKPHISTHV